jgi:hypothetical protein
VCKYKYRGWEMVRMGTNVVWYDVVQCGVWGDIILRHEATV